MGYNNWTLAIRGWADEKKDFVYGSKIQHGIVGHYTQLLILRNQTINNYMVQIFIKLFS